MNFKANFAILFLCLSVSLSHQLNYLNVSSTQAEANEINDDDGIAIKEPYKSILQTTIKIAISQTRVPNHINIDTAMGFLNKAGSQLAKPKVLFKVLKGLTVAAVSILLTSFLFPSAYKFLDSAYQDPIKALVLDKYFNLDKLEERNMLSLLSTSADGLLSRVGLQSGSCRQKSICYIGEMVRCMFPETSKTIIKFSDDNLSNSILKDNKNFDAFLTGFKEQRCRVSDEFEKTSDCFGDFLHSMIAFKHAPESSSSPSPSRQKEKSFQTLRSTSEKK